MPGLRIEAIGPDRASVRAAVHRAAFAGSTFTEASWRAMAAGLPYADGRCLVAYDGRGIAVAAATVWSAGPGRPGLLEPMGVHHEHRGRGHGTAVTVAAAAALRDLQGRVGLMTPEPARSDAQQAKLAGKTVSGKRLNIDKALG